MRDRCKHETAALYSATQLLRVAICASTMSCGHDFALFVPLCAALVDRACGSARLFRRLRAGCGSGDPRRLRQPLCGFRISSIRGPVDAPQVVYGAATTSYPL